jgi:hypothetical protein
METIKDLYKRLLDPHPAPLSGGGGMHRIQLQIKTKPKTSLFLSSFNLAVFDARSHSRSAGADVGKKAKS